MQAYISVIFLLIQPWIFYHPPPVEGLGEVLTEVGEVLMKLMGDLDEA
mgnify:CR=1 FL=1